MTPEQKSRAIEMRRSGMTYAAISKSLGVPRGSVLSYIYAHRDYYSIQDSAKSAGGKVYGERPDNKGAFELLKAKVKAMKGAA